MSKSKIKAQIQHAMKQHEYYLNQGMIILAMDYLHHASNLQVYLLKKS